MSKKSLDYEKSVSSELSGRSAFFPNYLKEASQESSPPLVVVTNAQDATPTSTSKHEGRPTRTPRTPVRPVRVERPVRRQMIRHPFELYMDQLESLRARADAMKRQGETGSMSQMVRQAIDAYLDVNRVDE